MSSEEIVDLGVRAPETINAPFDRIWAVMVDKVYNTSKYLPVTDVQTEDVGLNHVHREMNVKNGGRIVEEIYLDKEKAEIRFAVVGEDEIHVNKFHKEPDKQYLEYWSENQQGQRISWKAPKSSCLGAMKTTKELAEQAAQ